MDEASKDGQGKASHKHRILWLRALAGVVLLGALGLVWWLHLRHFESTDDAYLDANIVRLAPQIPGRVSAVLVDDNATVRPGQILVQINSADVRNRVAAARTQQLQAQAQVANSRAQIEVNQAAWREARDQAVAAEAEAGNAASELARYRHLAELNGSAVAEQALQQYATAAARTAAQRDAALDSGQMHLAQVRAAQTQLHAGEIQVHFLQVELDQAARNLGYASVVAPVDGHIAQKSVAVGDYVQPGTQLLAIVPLQLWITANFKETQLEGMHPGQPVAITIDACPDREVTGHVDSIQRGAGQAFGLLPAENATGNFVKVVQRVPVKILLDTHPADCILGPGMSVESTVRVR